MKMNRRKRLFLLLFSLGLILVAGGLVLLDRAGTPSDKGSVVRRSDLSISNFQHTATEKGKILWTLEADKADYTRKNKLVDLLSVKIDYYRDDGTKITATSETGLADMGLQDLELSGSVVVISPDYTVKSDHLLYVADNKSFLSPGKTFISGEGFSVEADSAKYETTSGLLFLSGNVKGELDESP